MAMEKQFHTLYAEQAKVQKEQAKKPGRTKDE